VADRLFAIGLGSNVGDRLGYLCRAMALIDRVPHLAVLAASHIHESAGWGREDLDPFLNAVLVARSDRLTAHEVLRQLRRIEDRLGRQRTIKWGPRTLDLDLLAADDEVQGGDELTLPHPWIKDRPFVYLPLREVEGFHPRWAVHALASQAGLQIEKDTNRSDLGLPAWSAAVVAPATAVAFPSPHVEAGELPSLQTVETASRKRTRWPSPSRASCCRATPWRWTRPWGAASRSSRAASRTVLASRGRSKARRTSSAAPTRRRR
jgi:2-amino-4-hydroxy-6-hydroxymethyldihydropteridine diphosphokinase